MSNNTEDSFLDSLFESVSGFISKPANMTPLDWVKGEFEKNKTAWATDEQRAKDASEIIIMTDAFDREREKYDVARAEGRSSANYLMGLIDKSVAENGASNPDEIKKEIYSSVMDGGKALLKERGLDVDFVISEEKAPEWNEENKGEMSRGMTGALGSSAILALGEMAGSLDDAAEKRIEESSNGDSLIASYVDQVSDEKSCKGLAIPMSAAIVQCARRGLLGDAAKVMPADAITTTTCIASEGVKTLVRVGKGELSFDEGREKIAETMYVAAGAYIGKNAGEKAGRYLGNLVGGVFGPVGSMVCGKVCEKVGGFIGHKVGGAVGRVAHKAATVYRKAKEWVREKIGGVVRSMGSTVCGCFSKVFSWL